MSGGEPGRRGAVLLEVLAALVLLLLLAGPLLQVTRQALARGRAGSERLAASRAAENLLAELAAGAREVPAPGGEIDVEGPPCPCRLRVEPAPAGSGLVVAEVRCGSLVRRALLAGGAEGQ